MSDIEGKDVFGSPLDAKHTRLVAQGIPSRLERVATAALQGMLADHTLDDMTPKEFAEDAVRYAKALLQRIDEEGEG